MLRVQTQQSKDAIIFRLEGRFTREGAEHVRALVAAQSNNNGTEFIFDLTELLFVDSVGEEVLSFLRRLGARFVAETAYALDVCERLDLPLAHKAIPNTVDADGSSGHGAI
jgi:ABC-type transporter Mla MlaB component